MTTFFLPPLRRPFQSLRRLLSPVNLRRGHVVVFPLIFDVRADTESDMQRIGETGLLSASCMYHPSHSLHCWLVGWLVLRLVVGYWALPYVYEG